METKTFKANKTYEEAKELFNNLQNANPEDKEQTLSLLTYAAVNSIDPTTVLFLENLTGVDLSSKEKLYDYYKSNIKGTDDFIAQVSLFQLAQSGGVEKLLDTLKEELKI